MVNSSDVSALTSSEIVQLLELEYSPEVREQQDYVLGKAGIRQLTAALKDAHSAGTRRALCYALGRRCSSLPVLALIGCLYDEDANVRTEAAEALGNIGDSEAGPILLERFITLTADGAREGNLLAYALGAVGYRPAIPALLNKLKDPRSYFLHGSIAVALGVLGAVEAEDILKEMLESSLEEDNSKSSVAILKRSLAAIQQVREAFSSKDVHASIKTLGKALNNPDPLLSESAAWALSILGGSEAEMQLRQALTHRSRGCAETKRLRDALTMIK